MVRLGVDREYCGEPVDPEEPEGDMLRELQRTPLEFVPNSTVRKILRKLGGALALEVMEEVKRVEAKHKRPMNDYNAWSLPYISHLVDVHADDKERYSANVDRWRSIRLKKAEREALFREWLPTSNTWDSRRDRDETFVVEKFDGFRKKGVDGARKDQFHVVWAPRIFAADVEYPEELPECRGLPWDVDENESTDWVDAKTYMTIYKRNKDENAEFLKQFECLMNGGVMDGVGVGVGVGGLE